MGEKEKTNKKVSKQIIWIVLLLLLVAGAGVTTLVKVFQDGVGQRQISDDKARAYLASTDSNDYGVTEEEVDEWLRAFLEAEGKDSVEINRTLLPTKGYDVNGTKTMTGSGEFVYTKANGGTAFRVNEGASFTVEGISVKGEKNIGLGANVKANGTLVWKDGSILEATEYGILCAGDVILEGVAIEESSNWLLLNRGASGKLTNVNFYMGGGAGIVVEAGASCEIDGKDTILERTTGCAIKNNGELVMKGGRTFMTTGYGIENYGTAEISNVTMNRSITGGGVLNEKGAVVKVQDCTFENNKYHIRNSGEMTLSSCKMLNSSGSAVYSDVGGILELADLYIHDTGYNGLYVLNSTVTVNNLKCEVINSTAITVMGKNSTVNVDGLEVDNCNVAIRNGEDADKTYGKITASNITVKNADSYNIVSYGGTCDVSDSTLYPSKGYSVYIRSGSSELDSVKILGTSVEGKGGLAVGSSKFQDAKVVIKGDTEITGCMGSGISNDGTLTIHDVDIHDNNASGKNERGTGIISFGTIYLHGGEIHDNYAVKYGAGIWLGERTKTKQAGKLYMHGGKVYDNVAGINGGGITIGASPCLLEMHGGSVTGNMAYGKADGILVNGRFALYDADSFEDNDVYLYSSKNKVQVLSDSLSFEKMKIVPDGYTYKKVLVEFKNAKAASELCKYFTTRNHQFTVGANDKNGILINNIEDFDTTYDFSKASNVTVTTFEQLKKEIEGTKIGTSKVICIASDIVLTDKITLPVWTDIKLTDDGTSRVLTRGVDGNLFVVTKASHLVMSGTSQLALDGGATSGVVAEHGLVTVKNFGYFVLEGNAVVQNAYNVGTTSSGGVRGAAVNLDREGYFLLKGGTIKNCSSPDDETYNTNYCAVYLATSSGMSIKSGTITDCNDRAVFSYGKVYMSGGSIDNCSHMKSGGASFRGTTLVMTGGTMENCVSTNSGSAVFMITSSMMPEGYFLLDGGTICNNVVGTALSTNKTGGAVYIAKNCVFDFKSGSVSNNVAGDEHIKMSGAGINNAGTTNIGAGAIISGNVATLSHGGIYNTGTMTITGATITKNTSTYVKDYNGSGYGSGGAIFNKGTLYMDGAKVVNNNLGTTGTIYNDSGNLTLKNMTFKGNVSSQDSKGVDLRVAASTESATLSGKILANESDSALRLDLDKYFVLADDFSSDSKINLYLAGTHYDGRRVLAGNLNAENVGCFTWTNASDGWHLAEDGCIYMTRPEAKIGETIYATLEAAIAAAEEGETIHLIDDVELSKQVKIKKAITITTDGNSRTICISEELGNSAYPIHVSASGKNVTFKGSSENAKLVIKGTGTTEIKNMLMYLQDANSVTMTNVDIQDANRNGNGGGGAINSAVPLILTNCNFTNCKVASGKNGGAITCTGNSGTLTATNCTFENCHANGKGGAINGSTVKLTGCTFTNCQATSDGGAVYGSAVELTGCAFANCQTSSKGGAINSSAVELTGCTFTNCQATSDGGAVYGSAVELTECTFEKNSSGSNGGAVCVYGTNLFTITDCEFTNNQTINQGGAIFANGVKDDAIQLIGCTFEQNTAGSSGGAVHVGNKNTLNVKDSSFNNNTATANYGGAIAMGTGTSEVVLEGNVIFANNTAGESNFGGGAVMTGNGFTIKAGANVTFESNTAKESLGGAIYFNGNAPVLTLGEEATLVMTNNADQNGATDIAVKNGKSVVLHHGNDYSWYANLTEAAKVAVDGDEIILTADVELDKQVKIENAVTITTDGNSRTIRISEELGNSAYPIHVSASGKNVTFKGSSENAKLVIKGTGTTEIKNMLMYLQDANSVTMTNVDIQDGNRNGNGGGGAINSAVPLTLTNCNFTNCKVSREGATNGNGGAIMCSSTGSLTIENCKFEDCYADGQGGAIYCGSTIELTDCAFENNSSDVNGGAIWVKDALSITGDVTFNLSEAKGLGGAIYFDGNSPVLTLNEGASLEMTNSKDQNGETDIAVKNGKSVVLHHGNDYSWYANLTQAAETAVDGDKIILTADIELEEPVVIENAVIITTDETSRIISVSKDITGRPIHVNADGKDIVFKGSSENTKLVIKGTGTEEISYMLMYFENAKSVTMEYVNIQDANRNGSGGGGAINSAVPLTLTNCNFTNCKVTASGKNGGAITGTGSLGSVKATNCTFTNCRATNNGGVIYCGSTIELTDCTFEDNSASNNGGAIWVKDALTIAGDVTFNSNEATNLGGAICFDGNSPVLTLNEGANLEMTNSKDQNGKTDIAFKDETAATINLNGSYKINRIYAGAGTEINLDAKAQNLNTEKLTMVYLTGTLTERQLVKGSNVANTIFAVASSQAVSLNAEGYLVGIGKPATLVSDGVSEYCDSLATAVSKAKDGDTIIVKEDIELATTLEINDAVTITTDGVDRTVSVKAINGNPILVKADSNDVITFRGSSADAELSFNGTGDTGIAKMLIYLDNAESVIMDYVKINSAHRKDGSGGGIYSEVPLTLTNCDFTECKASGSSKNGGAIVADGVALIAEDCTFSGCEATGGGGAIRATGSVELTRCTFTNNKSSNHGGAVSATGTVELTECTFKGNESTAGGGGAVYVGNKNTVTIDDCKFESNHAVSYGGAVALGSPDSTLNLKDNCLFEGNTATGGSTHSAGAILAPAELKIISGAVIEMKGNDCTSHPYGDAISINQTDDGAAKFTIESSAALYVYDDPDQNNSDKDVCLEAGGRLESNNKVTFTNNGVYSTSAPTAQTSVQNLYTAIRSAVLNFRSMFASL